MLSQVRKHRYADKKLSIDFISKLNFINNVTLAYHTSIKETQK